MDNSIYMDSAATTKVDMDAASLVLGYMMDYWHNPSSLYKPAKEVKQDIEDARADIAKIIGAEANEIYFTSGGSESNCWAIRGWIDNRIKNGCKDIVVITSPIEHKSIMEFHVANVLNFVTFATVNVSETGLVDEIHLHQLLKQYEGSDILVSIQAANNEIGTMQILEHLSDIVHRHNAVFHVDAVQVFCQIAFTVKDIGADMLSASGHKIGAPKGIGFLYKSKHVDIEPLIYGSQMDGLRGGTENVPYIMAMAHAAVSKYESMDGLYGNFYIKCCRNEMMEKLEEIGCKVVGNKELRLPNNINVMLPEGVGAEEMLYMLDAAGIYVSTGSACNSNSKKPSHVLKAIGLTDEECSRCLRITLTDNVNNVIIYKVVKEIERLLKLF